MATVAVDFDGVIHSYDKGWQDGSIYGELVPGALEALRSLMERYAVFVHTTRDPYQIEGWLAERGVPCVIDNGSGEPEFWNDMGVVLVTRRKYPAIAYIDDRALHFVNWAQALATLAAREHPAETPEPPRTGLDKVADAIRAARGGGGGDPPVQIRGFA
jgi:hypothetical protein